MAAVAASERRAAGDGVRWRGYCEREVDQVEWQISRVDHILASGETIRRAGND
jgi:hypothetical protein